jgi:hypothetical protein
MGQIDINPMVGVRALSSFSEFEEPVFHPSAARK